MIHTDGSSATHAPLRTYELEGVPYLPSYSELGVFVGPGGQSLDESTLVKLGATMRVRMLWMRKWMRPRGKA